MMFISFFKLPLSKQFAILQMFQLEFSLIALISLIIFLFLTLLVCRESFIFNRSESVFVLNTSYRLKFQPKAPRFSSRSVLRCARAVLICSTLSLIMLVLGFAINVGFFSSEVNAPIENLIVAASETEKVKTASYWGPTLFVLSIVKNYLGLSLVNNATGICLEVCMIFYCISCIEKFVNLSLNGPEHAAQVAESAREACEAYQTYEGVFIFFAICVAFTVVLSMTLTVSVFVCINVQSFIAGGGFITEIPPLYIYLTSKVFAIVLRYYAIAFHILDSVYEYLYVNPPNESGDEAVGGQKL